MQAMDTPVDAAHLEKLMNAFTTIGSDLDLDGVLAHIVEAGVELVDATYGALGVLSPDRSHLSSFVTVGLDDEEMRAIGDPPKGHGILGLLIVDPAPLRLPDLTRHSESYGFPDGHPPMTSFLGVPVYVRGQVYGNLYLTDKAGGGEFSDLDQKLAVGLAAAAGAAIDNARLYAQVREVTLLEDRERIARDLHDTVIQRLFATGLMLQGAARLAERPEVVDRIVQAVDDLDATVREVRTSIFELNAPRQKVNSVRRQLLEVGDELSDALGFVPSFQFEGPVDAQVDTTVATHLVTVVREALSNAARHARTDTLDVVLTVDSGQLTLLVDDTGVGRGVPSPNAGTGRGLVNLRQRAQDLGGSLAVEDRPGGGTRLRWSVPC